MSTRSSSVGPRTSGMARAAALLSLALLAFIGAAQLSLRRRQRQAARAAEECRVSECNEAGVPLSHYAG